MSRLRRDTCESGRLVDDEAGRGREAPAGGERATADPAVSEAQE